MHITTINIIVLIAFVLAAVWTVLTRSLLRSAIGLALTSAVLTILMFRLDSPLAAVFELSVCTGLISVVFISTISLTQPLSKQEVKKHMIDRLHRFWFLPVLLLVAGALLSVMHFKFNMQLPAPEAEKDVRIVLWHLRPIDIIGQVMLLFAGVFGVVILFKESRKK